MPHHHNRGRNPNREGQRNNRDNNNDFMLTTPYNFVPLSKKVVRPGWSSLISHDIPFVDPQSGILDLTIIAEQPIFTRNNVSRRIADEQQKKELGSHFSISPNNLYYIPGSSIKGSIRSVLEIMSFGDLAKGLNNEIWGMRDLTLQSYKDLFSWSSQIHCGWLKRTGNEYEIEDCGTPHRISHQQIDTHFNCSILSNWLGGFEKNPDRNRINLKYNFSKGLAQKKYQLFDGRNLTDTFQDIDGNSVTGTLVFKGQPTIKFCNNNRGTINVNQGESIKYKEFIFGVPKQTIELEDKVVDAFEFANGKIHFNNGASIPVFFHKDSNGNIASFGLAYMYKIPFTHSVKDAIHNFQNDHVNTPDLAECIFGHTQKHRALKGRVTFGHAFADGNPTEVGEKNEVLSSPKATYYPTYIRQSVDNQGYINSEEYKTLFDNDAEPSGWKRYPVHGDGVKTNPGPLIRGHYNENIQTRFHPLPVGTVFNCKVNYHNLNKIELGALLSALTFHETENCFHSLGMAKPLGYGKCTIEVKGIDDSLKIECLCAYETYMEKHLSGKWLNSEQIKELIAMSRNQNNTGRSELKYMQDVRQFANAKKQKLALDKYTNLPGISSVTINSLCKSVNSSTLEIVPDNFKNPVSEFEKRKQELINELIQKRTALTESKNGNKKEEKQSAISTELPKSTAKIQVSSVSSQTKDASEVKQGDIIYGEVLIVDKPFCRVKLLLSGYSFSGETDLTGTKKIDIKVGQIVKCQLGNRSNDGEFKQVKFIS